MFKKKKVPSIGGVVETVNVDPSLPVKNDKPADPFARLEFNPVVIPEPAQPVKEKTVTISSEEYAELKKARKGKK